MFKRLSTAAALFSLLAGPVVAESGRDLSAEVARFVRPTPEARTEAVKALLDRHELTYTIEAFRHQDSPAEGRNVVVTIGDGPRDLLLTAHYDAERLKDGSLSHGVVDNAASAVIVAEAARRLAAERLNHRLVVIFFDQEELGLLGAQAWV